MNKFGELGMPSSIVDALQKLGITSPTPIQAMTIPQAMQGTDILASAPTGTGKTLAYALPILVEIMRSPEKAALILVPTRELASQVHDSLCRIVSRDVKMCLLIGGESITGQFKRLRWKPNFIIGTPGRINDHIKRGTVNLSQTTFLVLDETDRMLDMGFEEQLENIVECLPKERQTLMFSATFPHNIMQLSQKYLHEPQRVSLSKEQQPLPKIKQEVIRTSAADKFSHLVTALDKSEGSVIIFVKTKRGADQLSDKLRYHEYEASSMHGDLRQQARARVIKSFREQSTRIMVATDVAARGLDIPHIRYVINYDLPQCKEDYVHRIGRTGRAGAEGASLCLVAPDDNRKWQLIAKMLDSGSSQSPAPVDGDDDGYNDRPRKSSQKGGGRFGNEKRGSFGKSSFADRSSRPSSDRARPSKPRFKDERDSERPRYRDDGNKPRFQSEGRPRYNDEGNKPRYRDDSAPDRRNDERSSFRGDADRGRRREDEARPRYRDDADKPRFQGEGRPSYRSDEYKPRYGAEGRPRRKDGERSPQFAGGTLSIKGAGHERGSFEKESSSGGRYKPRAVEGGERKPRSSDGFKRGGDFAGRGGDRPRKSFSAAKPAGYKRNTGQ